MMRYERGFSLFELMVGIIVLGVMGSISIPYLVGAQRSTYVAKQQQVNLSLKQGMLSYAAKTTLGSLPTPFTGSGYTKTVYNPSDVTANGLALSQALNQIGVSATFINDDGSAAKNVRVYQLVSGITQQVPLYFQSGPLVTLTYQVAAIYLTECPFTDTSCNPTSATGVPGTSPLLTSSNYTTWNTTGTDQSPVIFSNREIQEQMLTTTVQNLDKIRDKFTSYVSELKTKAAAGDATNWFPAGATSMSGKTPATNQGCRDGWYSLATTTVLPTIGTTAAEYGTTAWGGAVEYCRDYDPTGTKTPDAVPHFAAIRIHGSVSSGLAPDGASTGNNVVLTF